VARGFSRYLALLCNQSPVIFLIPMGSSGGYVDYMACAVVLVLTLALCIGTRESSAVMTAATLLKLAMLLALVVVAFTQADARTFAEDFTIPGLGADGVFQGAAFVFFAYSAFDAVCNAAEEVRAPGEDPARILRRPGACGPVAEAAAGSPRCCKCLAGRPPCPLPPAFHPAAPVLRRPRTLHTCPWPSWARWASAAWCTRSWR
jgi:hypothetical protein